MEAARCDRRAELEETLTPATKTGRREPADRKRGGRGAIRWHREQRAQCQKTERDRYACGESSPPPRTFSSTSSTNADTLQLVPRRQRSALWKQLPREQLAEERRCGRVKAGGGNQLLRGGKNAGSSIGCQELVCAVALFLFIIYIYFWPFAQIGRAHV